MSNWRASRAALVLAFSAILLLLPGSSAQAAFPGKNGRIAFERWGVSNSNVYTMEADGSSQRQLLARRARGPAWSPHGTRIAFDNHGFFGVGGTIMVADADGSNVRELAHGNGFRDPRWSPNGRQIVFTGFADGPGGYLGKAYRMLILNSDDGRITFRGSAQLLPRDGLYVERPTWSPRAHRIAVEIGQYHRGVGETTEVFTMTPEEEDLRQLTHNRVSEYDLDWSPDGSRLLYVRIRAHADRYARSSDIVVMGKNGHDVHVLTHTKRKELSAAFSPNGRRIVFSKCCYGESKTPEIFVMRADGTHVVRLTHNEVYDFAPDWQPIPRGR